MPSYWICPFNPPSEARCPRPDFPPCAWCYRRLALRTEAEGYSTANVGGLLCEECDYAARDGFGPPYHPNAMERMANTIEAFMRMPPPASRLLADSEDWNPNWEGREKIWRLELACWGEDRSKGSDATDGYPWAWEYWAYPEDVTREYALRCLQWVWLRDRDLVLRVASFLVHFQTP